MSLRIRKVALRAYTAQGDYGADIPFEDGLVVVRAENSAGKSTCTQAIFYALGLEGMWSASHDIPLPHAMTDHLDDGETPVAILRSEVWLEIENKAGEPLTIRRSVKGGANTHLVSAWEGVRLPAAMSMPPQTDYYVREPGAAIRPRGFHHKLVEFLEWNLPDVERLSGDEGPLYLECIFPLFVVEQKRGWSSLQPRVPNHYRIRDVYRRSVEFLLGLDAYANIQKRRRLQRALEGLREEWAGIVSALAVIARQVDGTVVNPLRYPVENWDEVTEPSIQVYRDNWIPLAEAMKADRAALAALKTEEMPRVEQVVGAVATRLSEAEGELLRREYQLGEAQRALAMERAELEGLNRRLAALQEDLRKNQDVVKLRKLGSMVATGAVTGECPTCHQPITDSLLPSEAKAAVMPVEDNVEFIKALIDTFTASRDDSGRAVEVAVQKVASMRSQLDELRSQIRELKRTLVTDGRVPSREAIKKQIVLEQRIESAEKTDTAFGEQLEKLSELSTKWAEANRDLKAIPAENLSDADRDKLRRIETLIRAQLKEYGFSSVAPETVSVSADTFRPEHEGFDLDFDLSASDMVRAIWAYFYSLLAVARDTATNHPGLLVLDEPRQQETKRESFEALIKRVSTAGSFGQQVIIATSEELIRLQEMLKGLPHSLHVFPGKKIITKL